MPDRARIARAAATVLKHGPGAVDVCVAADTGNRGSIVVTCEGALPVVVELAPGERADLVVLVASGFGLVQHVWVTVNDGCMDDFVVVRVVDCGLHVLRMGCYRIPLSGLDGRG